MRNKRVVLILLLSLVLNFNKAYSSVVTVIQPPKEDTAVNTHGIKVDTTHIPVKKKKKLFKKEEYPYIPPFEYQILKYNYPAGQVKFDIDNLRQNKKAVSSAVISPDFSKIVFSEADFFPQTLNTNSKVFYVNINPPTNDINELQAIKPTQKVNTPLLETGYNSIDKHIFRLFTVIDWSEDSSRILVKETIGEYAREIWVTQLWVYDFNTNKSFKLPEINDAVIFYWRNKKNIDLKKYKWDIEPLGWSKDNPNRIMVKAIGYKDNKKTFLGLWSIDFQGNITLFSTLEPIEPKIQQNGYVIKKYQK